MTVVVGNAVPIARNTAFQVRARAVPLSLILIISDRPCTRVPHGALNKRAPACAVIINSLKLSIFREVPVSVVYEVAETTRGVVVITRIPSTARVQADDREIVVSEALPSSIFPVVVIVPSDGLSPEYTMLPSVTAVSS